MFVLFEQNSKMFQYSIDVEKFTRYKLSPKESVKPSPDCKQLFFNLFDFLLNFWICFFIKKEDFWEITISRCLMSIFSLSKKSNLYPSCYTRIFRWYTSQSNHPTRYCNVLSSSNQLGYEESWLTNMAFFEGGDIVSRTIAGAGTVRFQLVYTKIESSLTNHWFKKKKKKHYW